MKTKKRLFLDPPVFKKTSKGNKKGKYVKLDVSRIMAKYRDLSLVTYVLSRPFPLLTSVKFYY
jgi:hypothetical protein